MVLKIGTPLEVLRSALPPTAVFADMDGNIINDPLLQCTLTVPREVRIPRQHRIRKSILVCIWRALMLSCSPPLAPL